MKKYWILTIGLLAMLAACSSATPAGPASGTTLNGTSWTVTQIRGRATIPATPPTMKFAAGQVSGTTGCNNYGAAYTQNGSSLTFSQARVTAMACGEAAVTIQESTFLSALPTVTAVRGAATGTELLDINEKVVFTLAPVVDKPLEGTEWTLTGLIANQGVSTPVANSTVTMTIEDGTLTGKACNSFSGPVTAANGDFKAGPLTSTKMACPSPELTAQETKVLANLEAANHYEIEADTLKLTGDDGTGLVFTAA